jgi:hypothetical protein
MAGMPVIILGQDFSAISAPRAVDRAKEPFFIAKPQILACMD